MSTTLNSLLKKVDVSKEVLYTRGDASLLFAILTIPRMRSFADLVTLILALTTLNTSWTIPKLLSRLSTRVTCDQVIARYVTLTVMKDAALVLLLWYGLIV